MTTNDQLSHILRFCQRSSHDLSKAIAKARTQWLRDWLEENLPFIIDLQDTPSDHEAAKQWDTLAKKMMSDRGLKTLSQQKNLITDIRNAIKVIDPHHPALDDIGFTTEQWIEINRPSQSAVSTHVTKFIDDPSSVVNKAIELLNSRDWYDLAVALAVLTGRRCAEVLKTAKFSYVTPYSVWFVGAVKRGTEEHQPEFEIPTLAPANDIIATITKLRQWIDTREMDNNQINNNYSKRLGEISDRHFKGLVPPREGKDNLYTHIFRAVYATVASHWYCPPALPVLEFRAYIQGHFRTIKDLKEERLRTLASQRHYLDYAIGDGNGNVDGRLGIKLGSPGVEVVKVFKSYHEPSKRVKAVATSKPQEQPITVNPTQKEDTQQGNPTSTGVEGIVEENREMAETPKEQAEQGLSPSPVSPTSTSANPTPSTPELTKMASEEQQADTVNEPKQLTLQDLQQTITSMLRSKAYTVVLTALMAATGRSPGELLKSKVLEINPDEPFSVFERYTIDNKTTVLPTLIEGATIVKAIAKLKKHRSAGDLLYLAPKNIDLHCIAQIEQRRVISEYFSRKSVDQLYQAYSTAILERASLTSTPTATQSPTSKKTNKKKPGTNKGEKGTAKGTAGRTPKSKKETVKGKAGSTPTTSKGKTRSYEAATLIDSWGKVALQLKERFGLSQPEQLIQLLEGHSAATTQTEEAAQQQTSQYPQQHPTTLDIPVATVEGVNSSNDSETSQSLETTSNVKGAAETVNTLLGDRISVNPVSIKDVTIAAEAANVTKKDDTSVNPETPTATPPTASLEESPTDTQTPGVKKTKTDIPCAASVENASNNERISRLEEMFELNQISINQLTEAIGQLVNRLSHQTPLLHPQTPLLSSSPTQDTETSVQQESTASISRRATQETSPNSTEAESPSQPATPKNSTSLEKINRAIDLIIDHNNSAKAKKDKWLVSLSALKQLTKCGQDTIARVLTERASKIEQHHELHELGKFHNNKGKFAPPISNVIKLGE